MAFSILGSKPAVVRVNRRVWWAFCVLSLGVSGCSGGGGKGNTPGEDGGMEPVDEDAGVIDEPEEVPPECEDFGCVAGQRCESQGGKPVCTGSCDGIQCAEGLRCEVGDNLGRCVPACEPACSSGQRCERASDNSTACVDNTCSDLDCGELEACAPAPDGTGFVCVDNRCDGELDCAPEQNCNGTICVGDVCEPGTRQCDGSQGVRECMPNGSGEITRFACPTQEGLVSSCVEGPQGVTCSCRDDWDCPAFTECVQGSCQGTGRKPTCFLPPAEFADLLPRPKPGFPWGGDDTDGYVHPTTHTAGENLLAHGSPRSRDAKPHVLTPDVPRPFARYSQVSAVPVVANLDDDNGDGRINELDTPEIVFPAFCDTNYQRYGMLRAVHGGGPKAGQDYFALCNNQLWKEGQTPVLGEAECACDQGNLEPNGGVAVGDLDGDGVPEIITVGHAASDSNNRLVILRNTGDLISEATLESGTFAGGNPAVTIANIDHQGFAELVIGATVAYLQKDGDGKLVVERFLRAPAGGKHGVNNGQGAVSCVAELKDGGNMEVVAGGTAYRVPSPVDCATNPTDEDGIAFCDNLLRPIWDAGVDGFCAVADVLGAKEPGESEGKADLDHPLDGAPEVVLISAGKLLVLDGASGEVRYSRALTDKDGGPPNIDDFDGDGFPEVGTAFATFYVMYDFQPPSDACPAWPNKLDGDPASAVEGQAGNPLREPVALSCERHEDCGDPQFGCSKEGQCVCLHNGWTSKTQDASSRVTGSSVFDFNGDGAAEVVYNDECFFRIYDGRTGKVYQRLDSQSPTRIEYPVVADVDSDGNAEIVFSGSNARSEKCGRPLGTMLNGINVIGDPTDRWISARRIWNQHAYHVTNVHEDGLIPTREVRSWGNYGGRSYNIYRSNVPPIGNVAPDLSVEGLQVSSPGVTCGGALSKDLKIVALVANIGDLRTGPEVIVRFVDQDGLELGTAPIGITLEPGAKTFVSLAYQAPSAEQLPSKVRAVVDYKEPDPSVPDLQGAVRECKEDNNEREIAVVASSAMPELRVAVSAVNDACPRPTLKVEVFNDSDLNVPSAVVALYAGNPETGGALLEALTFTNLSGHASQSMNVDANVGNLLVNVHAVVDPERLIAECDDGNNSAAVTVDCAFSID